MVKASIRRRGHEMLRSILSVAFTLVVFLVLVRTEAQAGEQGLTRYADDDERTVIFHRKLTYSRQQV